MQPFLMTFRFKLGRIFMLGVILTSSKISFGQVVPILPFNYSELKSLLPIHSSYAEGGVIGIPINDSTSLCVVIDKGEITYEGYRINDLREGAQFEFSEKGELIKLETYKKGCLDGRITEWNANGSVKYTGYYNCVNFDTLLIDSTFIHDEETGEDFLVKSASQGLSVKNLDWFFYDKKGVLVKKQCWKSGALLHEEEY